MRCLRNCQLILPPWENHTTEVRFQNPERLLPTSVVAQILEKSERTVRWYAQTGRIPAIREGMKLWKFHRRDVFRARARLLAQRMEAA